MKKRVISLVLCLLMVLSLIPTAAFAVDGATRGGHHPSEDPKPPHDNTFYASHIDVDFDGTIIYNEVTYAAKISNVSAEFNSTTYTGFTRRQGENQWYKGFGDKTTGPTYNTPVTIKCTATVYDNNNNELLTKDVSVTYSSKTDFDTARTHCRNKDGFDFNITAVVQEQISQNGTLTIKKVLADNAPDAAKNMTFKFNILDKDGKPVKENIEVQPGFTSDPISLPVGNYTVVELEKDAQINGYILNTTTVYGKPTGVSIQSNDPDAATDTPKAVVEKNKTTEVTVTNSYEALPSETGSLTITKYIYDENNPYSDPFYTPEDGDPAAQPFKAPNDAKYRFVVTGTVDGNKIEREGFVEIKRGETSGRVTIEDLPYGEYTVTEGYSDIPEVYPNGNYPDLLDGYTCCACIIGPMTAADEVGFVEKMMTSLS